MIRKTSISTPCNPGNVFPENGPPTVADRCFEAMVQHSQRKSRQVRTAPSNITVPESAPVGSDRREDSDLAWGAEQVAIEIFGQSGNAAENRRRRRRVFVMYEEFKKAVNEAQRTKRPAPANPGWVILPRCARIILSRSAYRAFLDSQLGGPR